MCVQLTEQELRVHSCIGRVRPGPNEEELSSGVMGLLENDEIGLKLGCVTHAPLNSRVILK